MEIMLVFHTNGSKSFQGYNLKELSDTFSNHLHIKISSDKYAPPLHTTPGSRNALHFSSIGVTILPKRALQLTNEEINWNAEELFQQYLPFFIMRQKASDMIPSPIRGKVGLICLKGADEPSQGHRRRIFGDVINDNMLVYGYRPDGNPMMALTVVQMIERITDHLTYLNKETLAQREILEHHHVMGSATSTFFPELRPDSVISPYINFKGCCSNSACGKPFAYSKDVGRGPRMICSGCNAAAFCNKQCYGDHGETCPRTRISNTRMVNFMNIKQPPTCDYCGVEGKIGALLRICGGCTNVKYCSVNCQTKGWPSHKTICKMMHDKNKKQDT